MAFFSGRGKSDKGSRKSDHEEYGTFHVKCGEYLKFSNERRTVHNPGDNLEEIVYSAKPIPTGGMFQVKVVERGTNGCPLFIGFTRLDPDSADPVPKHVGECWESKDYWIFCGSTAYHDGTRRDISFSTSELDKGDMVGVRVCENGDVQYYVNGENKGRVFQHLPTNKYQDWWGVVCLWARIKIQSEFHYDLTAAENVVLLQEKVSRLEVAVQEKKRVATTQPGGVSQGDSEGIRLLRQHLATLEDQLAAQHQENRELASQVEHLTRKQGSLRRHIQQLTSQVQQQTSQLSAVIEQNHIQQQQQEQLATQLHQQQKELSTQVEMQQRLTGELAEQRTVIQEEMQQQFQALLQQIQALQSSWSIAEHHLQLTTQVLGRGAWGEVRVGIYQGTRVAVKKMHDVIISNHNRELFEREMIIASRVRHPHLVVFIGAVTTGNLTIVSELMETSLRKLLEEEKLTASHLHPISEDVACALAYLHSLPDPVVHRYVSSANVLLNAKQDGWCAKLSDFGSANFLAKLPTIAPGAVIYSAPEALHPRQQGPKMDVYSFGILLFEMCVGKLIDQHNLQSTKAAVANWTDQEKKFLGEFALRCTETNPVKRPNMADFVEHSK